MRLSTLARATLAALLMASAVAVAQDVTEPALKAAFIYNFAKFTEWPADLAPSGRPLVMCVVGDPAVRQALERVVKDRVLGGHAIAVTETPPADKGCHVLYISGVAAAKAVQFLAASHGALTISDLEGFKSLGGVAEFFFLDGRLRFSVDVGPAERAGLRLSSRLLALGIAR